MRKLIVLLAVIASSAIIVTSCGGKKTAEIPAATAETVEGQKSQLAEALSTGNLRQASAMADSMSLFVDDFTPEQTVQVLSAFVKVYSDAQSKRESRRALETVRKYVDVYDIALSVNPKDTRAAFEKARRAGTGLDFDSIARAFREKLSNYDAMQDGSLTAQSSEPADTAKAQADTVSATAPVKEIPLEHRPTE